MRRVQYSALLIVILLLIFAPLGAYAQDNTAQATTNAAPQPLTIFTTYPSQVIGLDETVSLPLKVRSGVAETVNVPHFVRGYYSIPHVNPNGIIPRGPKYYEAWLASPHDRGRFGTPARD